MAYGIKSLEYLYRARIRLDENRIESLFYAALELRGGIEARLKEYFDAQAETTKKKREGWRIAKLARQIESVFKLKDKGLRLVVFDADTSVVIATVLYTPVTRQLQKMCEKLGDFLHSQEIERHDTHPHWIEMRHKLETTYEEFHFATLGTLMAPPLEHPSQPGHLFFCLTGDQREIFPAGKRIGIRFEHYEVVPL